MLAGCVQPSMVPNINSATARVLDAAGIQTAGRCPRPAAAARSGSTSTTRTAARRRCAPTSTPGGRMVAARRGRGHRHERLGLRRHGASEYGHILAGRPGVCGEGGAHQRAHARPERTAAGSGARAEGPASRRRRASLAFHPPCTLQHGQKLRGGVEANLRALGFDVQVARNESHLCCGSAGTYSVLQPELAYPLRDRKLGAPEPAAAADHRLGQHRLHPHLQSGSETPVRHWVEVLDAAIRPAQAA